MKVVVCTAGSPDFNELAEVTNPSKDAYAELHGYQRYHHVSSKADGDLCKFKAYEALRTQYGENDIFFWSDLDALITNSAWTVEDIIAYGMEFDPRIGKHSNTHFLWGWDAAGPNSGVYFARFSSRAYHFMDRYTATMLENGLGDNTAMIQTALIPPFSEWVRCIKGTMFNAYPYELYGWDKYAHADEINRWKPGCFMAQIPGIPNEVRIPILRDLAVETGSLVLT